MTEPDQLTIRLGADATDKIIRFDMCHRKLLHSGDLRQNPVTYIYFSVYTVMSAGRAKPGTDREPTGFFPGSDRVRF